MTSFASRFPRHLLRVGLVSLFVAGCVGSIEESGAPGGGGSPDASTAGDPDGGVSTGGADAGSPDAARACDDPIASGDTGAHRAGEACRTGCHTPTTNGPAFTVAGTLYTDAAGSAPIDGATIHVIDGNGTELALVTKQNGNFWTNAPVVFPLTVFASRCPNSADKVGPVTAAEDGGNCNQSGCHSAGSRIHLP